MEKNNISFNPYYVSNIKRIQKNENQEKKHCKVFKFSPQWNFNDALNHISSKIKAERFPNLFYFVIKEKSEKDFESIKNKTKEQLIPIGRSFENRLIILQIISGENTFYYIKEPEVLYFDEVDENEERFRELFSILRNRNYEILNNFCENLRNVRKSSTILRFIKTLNLSDKFYNGLIYKCATEGSKRDLLAVLDASFEDEMLSYEGQCILTTHFEDPNFSFLSLSIQNPNENVINYLISNCTHLIQQLPYEHRVEISTNIYEERKLKILCDLIDRSDFPFPNNLDESTVLDIDFRSLIDKRKKFHNAISNGEDIEKYVQEKSNLKIVFNINNHTALYNSIQSRQYKCHAILQSIGYEMKESESYDELTDKEKKKLDKAFVEQTKHNVNEAVPDREKSAHLLAMRSLIHNRMLDEKKVGDYRKKIMEWFTKIYKIELCSWFLDCAAQCDNLKIIFNFESEHVGNVDLKSGKTSHGTTYAIRQWIFIAAKESDKKDSFIIEGILIHEICHLVIRLIFENNEHPYFKNDKTAREEFESVCEEIRILVQNNDECIGIMSSVFYGYNPEDFQPELVVRPLQILAQYDGDSAKINSLREKYKRLFDFIDNYVVENLKIFNLQNRNNSKKINDCFETLTQIKKLDIKFESSKITDEISKERYVIIKTNVPIFFLKDLYQYLDQTQSIPSIKNIFISSDIEDKTLKETLETNESLKVIVNCISIPEKKLLNVIKMKKNSFIFIMMSNTSHSNISDVFKDNLLIKDVIYNFEDLLQETQQNLLRLDIDFQDNSNVTLNDLLGNKIDSCCFEDNEFINLITKKSRLLINRPSSDSSDFENELHLYQPRSFLECSEKISHSDKSLSEEELLLKFSHVSKILVSDFPRTGKSWTLKNIAKNLRKKHPNSWLSVIDLKQNQKTFSEWNNSYSFLEFMTQKILVLSGIEANIFKVLYNKGNVFILIDGFNEIQKEFRKDFLSFCKSFLCNGSNQMWITTRDYCKEKLLKELQMDVIFKLEALSIESGIDLVSKLWMLKDNKKIMENPSNERYLNQAKIICEKVLGSERQTIIFPFLFKIIAKKRKHIRKPQSRLKFNIFKELTELFFSKSNAEDIRNLHQNYAIQNSFSDLFNKNLLANVPDESILECGFMTKNKDTFNFQYEIFRDFFVAECLKNNFNADKFSEILMRILTSAEFQSVRVFFDGALSEGKTMKSLKKAPKKSAKEFDPKIQSSLTILFKEKLANLANLNLSLVNCKKNTDLKNILFEQMSKFVTEETDEGIFEQFFGTFIKNINSKDLKYFIEHYQFLQEIIRSNCKIVIFTNALKMIEVKLESSYVKDILVKEEKFGTLLHYLCRFSKFNENQYQQFFQVLTNFLSSREIAKILNLTSKNKENVLFICTVKENLSQLEFVCDKLKEYSKIEPFNMIKFLNQCSSENSTILHAVAAVKDEHFYDKIWNIILPCIENRKNYSKLMEKRDDNGDTFMHILIKYQKSNIVKKTIVKINEDCKNLKILKLKNNHKMTLLHQVLCYSKDLDVLKYLWTLFKKYSDDKNVLSFIYETDNKGNNVVQLSASHANQESLEFIMNEVQSILPPEEFKILLSRKNDNDDTDTGQDLLQLAENNFNNTSAWSYLQNVMQKNLECIEDNSNSHSDECPDLIKYIKINSETFNKTQGKIIFHHKDIEDRKVVALTIVGPFRTGKSYFLNYCLRYLYAHYPSVFNKYTFDKDNWMGKDDEPLNGFSWCSGTKRDTTGLVIWNDAFLYTDKTNGEKIAIIVIDTQGLFDSDTSDTDNKNIFVFGILISSILVLNFSREIQSHYLESLKFAEEFGKKAASNNGKKSFQNLIFLNRNWEIPEDYLYGIEHGNKYMEEKINIRTSNEFTPVHIFLRPTYDNISCSLVPHPGKDVSGGRNIKNQFIYDGNHGKMDNDYKNHFFNIIKHILHPNRLAVKNINGTSVTLSEFYKQLEELIKLYESDNLRDVERVYESICCSSQSFGRFKT